MKYLKLFQDAAQYEQFMSGSDFVLPNVSYVEGDNTVHYHPVPPPCAGAIVYKSGSDLLTVDYTIWDSSMGTPVGVLVIPEGFAPDGKARMMSLRWASSSSTSSTSAEEMYWGPSDTDTSLTNYNRVPTTDNAGSTTTGSNYYGYLPSDQYTGATSYVDSTAKYNSSVPYIPSPYLGNKPNPAYYTPISGYNNALADFNGKRNTDVLVGLGTGYTAANAARNYKATGAQEIEWYLPSIGELGYVMVRFNKIQAALTKLGSTRASQLDIPDFWSSTEAPSGDVFIVNMYGGDIYSDVKDFDFCVRPFALLA